MLKYFCFIALLIISGACAPVQTPTVGSSNVQYGDAKAVETVTNEFGSTDLQMIAETMTKSLLQTNTLQPVGRDKAVLTLADVKNKTSEYIDTKSITNTIRSQLLKSGLVRFAVDTDGMGNQVTEIKRQTQSGLYDKNKSAQAGKMIGADYRLEGEISSIVKKTSNVKDVYYKFTLVLIDNQTGTIDWSDEKEIRKTSEKPLFGY